MKLALTSLLVAVAASAVSAGAPQAAEPFALAAPAADRVQLARQFVNLSLPPDRFMVLMRAGAMSAVLEKVEGMEDESVRADAEKELDAFFARLEPTVRRHLPRLNEAYAQAYAREFSADELRVMIGFAGTPAGRHYLANREFVEEDPAVQDAQFEIMHAIQPVVDQLRREKCAEAAARRIAAGDTRARCPLSDQSETAAG